MKKYLIFLYLCLTSMYSSVFSQNPVVLVWHQGADVPAPGITVNILDSMQKKTLASGKSGIDGIVLFSSKIPEGKHPTRLSYSKNINGSPQKTEEIKDQVDYTRDTVLLTIGEKTVNIKEVTVTATRNPVKMDAKGVSMNLTSIPQAKIWTLEDALRQIPGIEPGGITGITYMGQPLELKENGFLSPNMKQNLSSYLKMPASGYTDINIQLMDLSLQENGASINFIRVKNTDQDIWGSMQGNAGIIEQKISGLIGLKKQHNLFEIAPNIGYQTFPEQSSNTHLYWTDSQQESHSSSKNNNSIFRTGMNLHYNFSTIRHLFDVNVFSSLSKIDSKYSNEKYSNDSLYITDSGNSKTNIRNRNIVLSAGYILNISKTSHLNVSFKGEYPLYKLTNDNRASKPDTTNSNYSQGRDNNDRNYFTMVSYDFRDEQLGDFEIGAKYFNRNQHTSVTFTGENMGASGDSVRQTYYENTYNYGAASASWSRFLGKFTANFVLTADYSRDRVPTSGNASYDYFTLSPYFALFRDFNGNKVRFTALYQEKRPMIAFLNPIPDPIITSEGLLIIEGNPKLKPTKEIRLTSNYSSVWLQKINASIFFNYQYNWDNISSVDYSRDTIRVRTSENLSSYQRLYLSANLRAPIYKKLSLNMSARFTPSATRPTPKSSTTWYPGHLERLSISYSIKKSTYLTASIEYSRSTGYQFNSSGRWTTEISAHANLKNQWSLGLNIMNPINTIANYHTETDAIGYTMISDSRQRQFNIDLSVNYRFGTGKTAKRGKEISIEDM